MLQSRALNFTLSGLVFVLATVFALEAAGSEDQKPPAPSVKPTTIVLVRHAEKDPKGDARDPGLSDEGKARAERLAKMFGSAGVTQLYATEFHRTKDTLAPLATAAKVEVVVTPGGKTPELLKMLDALPAGAIAVVAGHSNTVPAIAAHFGVQLPGLEKTAQGMMMPESAFDRVYVLTLPAKDAKSAPALLELRY